MYDWPRQLGRWRSPDERAGSSHLRILILNQFYPPDSTATAHLLGELTEDLVPHHEVWVIAGTPSYSPEVGAPPPEKVNLVRARTTTFNRASLVGRLVNYLSFFVSSAFQVFRVPKADVVLSLTNPPVIGLIAAVAAKRSRCPFILWSQDIHPDIGVALRQLDNRAVVILMKDINRLIRKAASRIAVVGLDMKVKLEAQGVPPAKLAFIPAWATASPLNSKQRDTVAEEMGWSGRLVVMHAGNIGTPQNLGILLDAAQLLLLRPEMLLVLLGDGAAKHDLMARARTEGLSNVVFLDPRDKDHAQVLMAAADLHLISLAPGLLGCATPSKMYSIMACSRPFIAAVDEGSEPDRVARESGCGLRIPSGDGPALAEAIIQLSQAPLDEMGARGYEAFQEQFSREKVTARFRHLLEDSSQGLADT